LGNLENEVDETKFLFALMVFIGFGIPIILGGVFIYSWIIWMVYLFLKPLMGLN
jgi:hypothetical protein